MGNLNCSNCKANADLFNEIKSDTSSIENHSYHQERLVSADLHKQI